jgi:heme exporter protein B
VFAKDVRAEMRNRAAINAILLFAITTLVVVGFATGAGGLSTALKAALLWVVLFFAAFSGLAHVFIHEEETSTSIALRLSASPGAVYAGKLLFNLLLLAVIGIVVVPLYLVMLNVEIAQPLAFLAMLVSGCAGLGAAATIVAAIIAKARGKGALYGALGFPILLPFLFMAVNATRITLIEGTPTGALLQNLVGLLSFATMLITASALLFPYVWED